MQSYSNGSAPTPQRVGLEDLFEIYQAGSSKNIHTQIPARVLEVDYEKGTVNVQPLIRSKKDRIEDVELDYPVVFEALIVFPSAQRGVARLSMPVNDKTTGVLVFSERNTEDFLNSDGLSLQNSKTFEGVSFNGVMNTLCFIPELITRSEARPFRNDAVVLDFDKAITTLTSDGEIQHKNDVATVTVAADGTITERNENGTSVKRPDGSHRVSNSDGFYELMEDGRFNINGFIINTDGSASSPVSVTAPTVTADTSLMVNGKEQDGHIHTAGAYVAGSTSVTGESGSQP